MPLNIDLVRLGHWVEPRASTDSARSVLGGIHYERHSSDCSELPFQETASFRERHFMWSGLLLFEFP